MLQYTKRTPGGIKGDRLRGIGDEDLKILKIAEMRKTAFPTFILRIRTPGY